MAKVEQAAAPRVVETTLTTRRPTRPVSPVGGGQPRGVATLGAAFSAALFGSGTHSPARSFTPSDSSEDEATRRRRAGQHFYGMAAPPSVLNDDDDDGDDGDGTEDDGDEAPRHEEAEEYTYTAAMGRGQQQPRGAAPPPPPAWQQRGNGGTWDGQDEEEEGSRGSGSSRSGFTASEGEADEEGPSKQRAPPAPPGAAPPQQPGGGSVWRVPDVSPGGQVPEARRSVLLVVDPKPKGAADWRPLLAAAAEAGHLSVAVVTSTGGGPQAAAALASRKEADFVHVICGSTHDQGALFGLAADILNAAQLGGFIPVAALPGSQDGALGCDSLAAMLGLPHNRLDTVLARRDKALACDIILGAGLAALPGGRARWPDDAWRVGRAHGFPLVVRDIQATSSPGSPAAWRCDTEASSGAAVGAAMELSKDPSQRTRRCVLVQPLLRGDPFMVSIFAAPRSGPRVTALWHFQPHASAGDAVARAHAALSQEGAADTAPRRAGGTPSCPYDQAVLVDATAPLYASLVTYALAACDALGWSLGVAHLKLRATAVTSPSGALRFTDHAMVAFNPWAAPGGFDALAARAMGGSSGRGDGPPWNPFAATVAAATRQVSDDDAPLLHLMPPLPRPGLHARVVYVAAPPGGGTLQAWEGEAAVMRLPSFVSHTLLAKPGAKVQEAPQPCRNAVAAVRLLHGDPRVVEQDARAVWSHLRCVVKPGAQGSRAAGRGQCAQQ